MSERTARPGLEPESYIPEFVLFVRSLSPFETVSVSFNCYVLSRHLPVISQPKLETSDNHLGLSLAEGTSLSQVTMWQTKEKMTNENTSSIEIDYEYEDCNSSKRPKMTSKVWEEMQRIPTTEGSKVLCRHCGKLLQDNCGTSHLKRHLMICPKRPKPLDSITRDSMAFRGPSSDKESGLNTMLVVRPLKVEPESQYSSFSQTPNIRGAVTVASIESAPSPIQELHPKTSSSLMLPSIESPKNQEELTLDDGEMKAFYASLDAETSVTSPSRDTSVGTELSITSPSEETKKALKTLQDLLSKDFSDLHAGQSGTIKSAIEHLSKLSADDGISAEMRLLILEVSREFTRWSCDYNDASRKTDSASTNISKADKLEESLEANKNEFKEVLSLENELSNQLSSLERRKKELEEQINAIKANIAVFQSAKITSTKRKWEVFEEAKTLKIQRDELRGQVPHLRDELEVAKKKQARIRAEWSKLGEKFVKSLNEMNCENVDGISTQSSHQESLEKKVGEKFVKSLNEMNCENVDGISTQSSHQEKFHLTN